MSAKPPLAPFYAVFIVLFVKLLPKTCVVLISAEAVEGETLQFFVPFDDFFKTADIAQHIVPDYDVDAKLRSDERGPYGSKGTSFSVKEEDKKLAVFQLPPQMNVLQKRLSKKLTTSFTFAMHFYCGAENRGGAIFTAVFQNNPYYTLSVSYNDWKKLEIYAGQDSGMTMVSQISTLDKMTWKFLAFVYDNLKNSLRVYGRNSGTEAIIKLTEIGLPAYATHFGEVSEFHIGAANRSDSKIPVYMKKADAIACFSYHEAALTLEELKKLPGFCETKGNQRVNMTMKVIGEIAFETETEPDTDTDGAMVVTVWSDELLNAANPKYKSAELYFQKQINSHYKAAGLQCQALAITGFKKCPSRSLAKTVAKYTVVIAAIVVERSSENRLLSKIQDLIDATYPYPAADDAKPKYIHKISEVRPASLWPKPSTLYGMWPLSVDYGFADIGPNKLNQLQTRRNLGGYDVASSTEGPFGVPSTAVHPKETGMPIMETWNWSLPLVKKPRSFTVALFFKSVKTSGGIFEFVSNDPLASTMLFQFRYLDVVKLQVSGNCSTIGLHDMIMESTEAWNFLVLSFDHETKMLTIFGRHGTIILPTYQPLASIFDPILYDGFRLGFNTRWAQGMQKGDAASCLAIYSEALGASDVKGIFQACRKIHGAAPCGSSKLVSSAPSNSNESTSVSGQEMFPFIISVRFDGRHICTASIIDQFWLLTAATCFADSTDMSKFSVALAGSGLNNAESKVSYPCSKVIFSSSGSDGDGLALLQLISPLDFSHPFVNDVCLYCGESGEVLSWNEPVLSYGWYQQNDEPRYVQGEILPDEDCIKNFADQTYDTGKDFCFMPAKTTSNLLCINDKGGPLLVKAPDDPLTGVKAHFVQVGVFIQRNVNCEIDRPYLFVNILPYKDWITSSIACAVPGSFYPNICPYLAVDLERTTTPVVETHPAPISSSDNVVTTIITVSISVASVLIACLALLIWAVIRHRNKKIYEKKRSLWEFGQGNNYIVPSYDFSELLKSEHGTDELRLLIEKLSISAEWLNITEVVGHGNFGTVNKAILKKPKCPEQIVAVKSIRSNSPVDFIQFLKEAYMMQSFEHENVLSVVGIAIVYEQPNIIVPFMEKGNLYDYLRSCSESNRSPSNEELFSYSHQVLAGMIYLSSKSCVHRDLACRNVLVSSNYKLKISDFGLARQLEDEHAYYRSADGVKPLPVRWHPPESLKRQIFQSESDVWSFGVVTWEIFSLCEQEPYDGLQTFEVIVEVCNGKRLDKPSRCSQQFYDTVMMACWQDKMEDRPTFEELHERMLLIKV